MRTKISYSLSYDYENPLSNVQQGTLGSVSYLYDGSGQRVQKSFASGSTTTYVYDAFGELSAEYSNAAPATPPCATCYLSWDHLGSTRMLTDGAGNVVARHDFLAFGDEIGGGTMGRTLSWNPTTDNTTQRFTGKERDESTLDYFGARYYSAALGRFASPDPLSIGADLGNPQSWNAYAYVGNSPLSAVDPDGMQSCSGQCVFNNTGTGSSGTTSPQGGTFDPSSSGNGTGGQMNGARAAFRASCRHSSRSPGRSCIRERTPVLTTAITSG